MDNLDARLPDMRKREALIVHIEGLQSVLRQRNEQIERLRWQLAEGGESPAVQAAVKKAFKSGWKECAQRLAAATAGAARELTSINGAAWEEYHAAEREGIDV